MVESFGELYHSHCRYPDSGFLSYSEQSTHEAANLLILVVALKESSRGFESSNLEAEHIPAEPVLVSYLDSQRIQSLSFLAFKAFEL